MQVIPHTPEMIKSAIHKAEALGSINNSILKGGGNMAGYLGEEAVAAFLGADVVSNDEGVAKYNHDLLLDGKRIEVKTKQRKVAPLQEWPVSIAKTSKHQKPDLFMFVSLEFDKVLDIDHLKHVWLVGQKTPEEYFQEAKFLSKGTKDSYNGFIAHVDMYNLPMNKLDKVEV